MIEVFGLDRLFTILVNYFRVQSASRRVVGIAAGLVVVGAGISIGVAIWASPEESSRAIAIPVGILGFLALMAVTAVLASYTDWPSTARPSVNSLDAELAKLAQERDQIGSAIRQAKGADLYSSLELNLNQLSEYYAINKSHARNSFRIGAWAVVLGFAAILAGIGLVYLRPGDNLQVTLIAGVAGLLGQFIGGYCFYLYNQASRNVATYYARLSQVQDTMLAVRLCELMKDVQQRNALTGQIVSALLARSTHNAAVVETIEDAMPTPRQEPAV